MKEKGILKNLRETYLLAAADLELFPEGSEEYRRAEAEAMNTSRTVFELFGATAAEDLRAAGLEKRRQVLGLIEEALLEFKKAADFAAASHTHDGYIQKPTSPASGNFVAFDGTTGAVKDSGKKAEDFAAASHSHAGYAEVKIFQNVTVTASAWANSSTYAGYPFAAVISCAGVTAAHVPEVTFGVTEATGGNFAPVALSGAGTVTIYAAEKPGGSITLPVIKCEKAV